MASLKFYFIVFCFSTNFTIKQENSDKDAIPVIDPALLNAVQPITIALPEIGPGVTCDIASDKRQGLVEKQYPFVTLPQEVYQNTKLTNLPKKRHFTPDTGRSYQSELINTYRELFKDKGCLHKEYDSYFTLRHPKEKTAGGWVFYLNNPDKVMHMAQGVMPLFDWLNKYIGFSESDSQDWFLQKQMKEISLLYPRNDGQAIQLKSGEFIKDALDDGRIQLKEGQINFLSAPTGSGKGCLAEYLCRQSDLPLLCVDPLRQLVRQTHDRLDKAGINVIHYETEHPGDARDCDALAICTPSVNLNKRVLEYFLNREEDTKINVLMDETHLLAKQLFDRKQLFPKFYSSLDGRVETFMLMSATPTANCQTLIERLQKDFYGS